MQNFIFNYKKTNNLSEDSLIVCGGLENAYSVSPKNVKSGKAR